MISHAVWSLATIRMLLFNCPVMSNSVTPSTIAHQASLSFSISWSLPKFMHQWCHPASSSSDALFSFCPQSFPASGTFSVSRLLVSSDQNTGASRSVLSMNSQGWFPLILTGLISLLSKGLSGVFFSTAVWRHQFLGVLPSLQSSSHNHTWPLERPQPWLYGPLSTE